MVYSVLRLASIQVQKAATVKGYYESKYLDYYQCLTMLVLQ